MVRWPQLSQYMCQDSALSPYKNPRASKVRWEAEMGESLKAHGPTSLVYTVVNSKEIRSQGRS